MGKVSPRDGESKASRRKRKSRSSSGTKYLKPGALSQLRYSKSSAKSCTDLGKKRVAFIDAEKTDNCDFAMEHKDSCQSPMVLSPVNIFKQNNIMSTPKTPQGDLCHSESRLESLPTDLLVKLLCHLHHDQLKAVFHVSKRLSRAVLLARQYHFNYTTPDRSRLEMLSTVTPKPTEHWPFYSKGASLPSPRTPKAPKHGPRPPCRIKLTEMRQIAAVLFQDQTLPSRCMVPSVLQKPMCKSLASNRVLFYEDELCHAVAQNKLR